MFKLFQSVNLPSKLISCYRTSCPPCNHGVFMDVEVSDTGSYLTLIHKSGNCRFHAIWLRDNVLDETTRDPKNGQRLITLSDLPSDLKIEHAEIEGNSLSCSFYPESKQTTFPLKWLLENSYDHKKSGYSIKVPSFCNLWDQGLGQSIPSERISALETDQLALLYWLKEVRSYGFAKVSGLKAEPYQLFRIVDLFGFVRETNYGRHFEVRTEVNPVNLAFTGVGLQAHTDNPYRDPVPTLQILSCLENSAEGGDSMVVDGFAVALKLKAEDPVGFDCLTKYPARFSFSGSQGVFLDAKKPMVELGPDREINKIRFNSRSAAPLIDIPFDDMENYYRAYTKLSRMVDDPKNQLSFKLKPGEAFIVDNTRILHSRQRYSGEGNRWLQGCYADKDSLISKLTALEKSVVEKKIQSVNKK